MFSDYEIQIFQMSIVLLAFAGAVLWFENREKDAESEVS